MTKILKIVSDNPWEKVQELEDLFDSLERAAEQARDMDLIDAANSIVDSMDEVQEAMIEALEEAEDWQAAEDAEMEAYCRREAM
jgi:molecular chaperone GrpE (heat shock protein)